MHYFGENMHKPCFFCIKGEKYTFLVWGLDKIKVYIYIIYLSLFALIITFVICASYLLR